MIRIDIKKVEELIEMLGRMSESRVRTQFCEKYSKAEYQINIKKARRLIVARMLVGGQPKNWKKWQYVEWLETIATDDPNGKTKVSAITQACKIQDLIGRGKNCEQRVSVFYDWVSYAKDHPDDDFMTTNTQPIYNLDNYVLYELDERGEDDEEN